MLYKPVNVALSFVVWILLIGLVVAAWNYRHIGYEVGRETGTVMACRGYASKGAKAGSSVGIYRQVVRLEDYRKVSILVDHCSFRDNGKSVSLLRKRRYLLGTEFYVVDDIQPLK